MTGFFSRVPLTSVKLKIEPIPFVLIKLSQYESKKCFIQQQPNRITGSLDTLGTQGTRILIS